jgi:hypothetical protein
MSRYQLPVYVGESPEGPFNRGAAINDAARKADADVARWCGDGETWRVAVVHDADTIAAPHVVDHAVGRILLNEAEVVYPYETYTYLDNYSSGQVQYRKRGPWFLSPEIHPTQGVRTTVRHHHVSGAMVVSRSAWEAVGGFIELEGWGAEDEIMHWLFKTFATPPIWLKGGAYHLFHPANRNSGDENDQANHQILADVMSLAPVPDQLRDYLRDGGHHVP